MSAVYFSQVTAPKNLYGLSLRKHTLCSAVLEAGVMLSLYIPG